LLKKIKALIETQKNQAHKSRDKASPLCISNFKYNPHQEKKTKEKILTMTEKIAYLILHEAKGRTAITGRTTHHFYYSLLLQLTIHFRIRHALFQQSNSVCYG